jgi:hypothetical protein
VSFPIPMADRQRRLPTAGRVKFGIKVPYVDKKTGEHKIKPKTIDTFRFTSRRRDDLDILAALYGGVVADWSDPKSEDRFEVVTDASEIRIALPPDPLGDGAFYELWGGKGLVRRCDGVECEVATPGRDGLEWLPRPCLCRERNVRECKGKLRLSVLLPEVPLRGTWRLDTGSDFAIDEIPEMVELIQHQQSRGLAVGLLRLERRQSQGGTQKFVVPCLGVAESLEGLLAGRGALTAPAMAQIEAGAPVTPPRPVAPASPDDEVVDAEIVEEEPSARDKARLLKVARARAILDGTEPPTRWEDIGA